MSTEETYNYKKLQNGSDIRGIALTGVEGENPNLGIEEADRLTKGFLLWLAAKTGKSYGELKVSVGFDPRLSGKYLQHAIINALVPYGVTVFNAGLASTPAMFMSTVFPKYSCDGAIMITASHLPFNRNGFKYFDKNGGLNKGDISEIVRMAESDAELAALGTPGNAGDFTMVLGKKTYNSMACELMDDYCAHLRQMIIDGVSTKPDDKVGAKANDKVGTKADNIASGGLQASGVATCGCVGNSMHGSADAATDRLRPLAGLKIVVDAGNGAGGFYASKVLAPLGADVSASQFLEADGTFPNHAPNPEDKDAMHSICTQVLTTSADFGLIFDTDVDRSSAVDERGREIARNGIVAMASALVAETHPGTTVVTDSITSNELSAFLTETLGLKHLRFKRGYKNVINESIRLNGEGTDSQLAIETSGHAALKENYFMDDGAYLATKIVIKAANLAKEGRTLSSVIASLAEPKEAIEVRFPLTCDDFAAYGDKVLEDLKDAASDSDIMTLVEPNYEGVRIDFNAENGNGWCLLRKSLHDPIMPLNLESNSQGGCKKIAQTLFEILSNYESLDITKLDNIRK